MVVSSFTCSCGNDVVKEYIQRIHVYPSIFYFWVCAGCGQEYREKAKEPVRLDPKPQYGEL